LSGHVARFHSGDTEEREIYTRVPDTEGEFVTDYKSFASGVEIALSPYYTDSGWFITSDIRQSSYTGTLKKDESSFSNTSRVETGREYILASFRKQKVVETRDGWFYIVPYLSDFLPPKKETVNYSILIVLSVKA
jgi:hypothetical protein